jgi:hypothetical protein
MGQQNVERGILIFCPGLEQMGSEIRASLGENLNLGNSTDLGHLVLKSNLVLPLFVGSGSHFGENIIKQ